MVHQTIASNSTSASNASSKISPMTSTLLRLVSTALIVGTLAACSTPTPPGPGPARPETIPPP
ncbi:transglycosylase, partial [Verminephrobacter eiseniae]|nr:transglycosylase [Verminephrobacter eiseniae]